MKNLTSTDSEVHIDVLSTPAGDVGILERLKPATAPRPEGGAHASIGYGIEQALQRVDYGLRIGTSRSNMDQ